MELTPDTIASIEAKKSKFKRNATVAAIGVTGLVVAPVILLALGGIVGLAVATAPAAIVPTSTTKKK